MMTAHLAFVSLLIGRRRAFRRDATNAASPRGRIAAALRRIRWQQAPPTHGLSDHLRRDIGLPPARQRTNWPDGRTGWR